MGEEFEKLLEQLIRSDPWFMSVLRAVRSCDPPQWLVGGGVIRNLVWDRLHGYEQPSTLRDVDVAYFDKADLRSVRDQAIEDCLHARMSGVPWQAKNQAAVHLWYEQSFGFAVEPLLSSADGVATWPETATSVAVRYLADDNLMIVAPCGLSDLFAMICRRNPRRVTSEIFRKRLVDKRIAETWPLVRVMDCS